jgi:16S rRNA (cytosine967-C5)-methyltransferase
LQKKPSRTARFVAVETLCHLYRRRVPVKPLLDRAVQGYGLADNERNLAMQLVYGVLRHRQYLDRILQLLSRTPLRKIDPVIHQAIVVGLYQLFFLERIPPSAAVNEMVECVKTAGMPKRLEGFVNGILRQSIRQKATLAEQADRDETGAAIVNHPEWLVARWRDQFGDEETLRICRANNCEPLLAVRTNTARISRADFLQLLDQNQIASQPGKYADDALVLPGYQGSITGLPGYAGGYFQVQDEAAQLATCLLGPFRRGAGYLDGCAGLGGKTGHLLQLAGRHDLKIHAVEPEQNRLKKLRENIARLSPDSSPVIHETNLQQLPRHDLPLFAGILIDAPCSGTGVTGRHPDIRWNRRPEDIAPYRQEQLALLEHAAGLLAPGGILVYATCSLEPEENIDVVHDFLRNHQTFALTDCSELLPEPARRFVADGCFAPRPELEIDGFFAARMQRRE